MFRKILNRFRTRAQKLPLLRHLGEGTQISPTCQFNCQQQISIGSHVYIGPACFLEGKGEISIGDGSILAPHVVILSSSHNYRQSEMLPYHGEDVRQPVTIGSGVWIGYGAMISPGVAIGDGAVIAMGSVVTRAVDAGDVVGGNPAKPISHREKDGFVERAVQQELYYLKNKQQ